MQKINNKYFVIPILCSIALFAVIGYFTHKNNSVVTSRQVEKKLTPVSPTTVPGWKTYISDSVDFQFNYPDKIKECTASINKLGLDLKNRDIKVINIACLNKTPITQIIYETSEIKAIDWWYSLLSENKSFFAKYGKMKSILFAGENASQITYPKEVEGNDHINQAEIIVRKGNKNYLVVFPHLQCLDNAACPERALEQEILNSFRFFGNGSATPINSITPMVDGDLYFCPTNGWVNCIPGPNRNVDAICSKEAQDWYKANCPNYQGVAY